MAASKMGCSSRFHRALSLQRGWAHLGACRLCKSLEDGMSLCCKLRKGHIAVGLLIALAVTLISSPALAQSDSNPKVDVFAGYQWLHPGGTVPTAGNDPNNPFPYTVPDMPK